MVTIEISELKERAEDVATLLRRGDALALTDQGKVVATSVTMASETTARSPFEPGSEQDERYKRAVREGRIRPPSGSGTIEEFLALPKIVLGGKSLLDHVLEARQEEYDEDRP